MAEGKKFMFNLIFSRTTGRWQGRPCLDISPEVSIRGFRLLLFINAPKMRETSFCSQWAEDAGSSFASNDEMMFIGHESERWQREGRVKNWSKAHSPKLCLGPKKCH